MNYLKERRKIFLLLGGGALLAIGFFALLSFQHSSFYFTASFSGIFVFIGLVCYPLAIVYGKKQITDVFNSIREGERQPFRVTPGKAGWNSIYTVVNFIIAVLVTVFFGWGYGTYTAYKKLQMLKGFQMK